MPAQGRRAPGGGRRSEGPSRSSWHGCKRANCSRGRRLWPAAGGGRHTRRQERRWCWRPLVADLSCEPGPSSTIISKFLGNFIPVALAEWLRRWPAKPLCSARVGSSPSGDEISFFAPTTYPQTTSSFWADGANAHHQLRAIVAGPVALAVLGFGPGPMGMTGAVYTVPSDHYWEVI